MQDHAVTQNLDFEYETCVNQYGLYCVPNVMRKREVCRIVLKGEVNEPRTLNFIRHYGKKGDVVSGGAFIGDFLPAIATALESDQILYSFEPNPMSFAAAQETIRLSQLKNVRLAPVAVGQEQGTVVLEVTSKEGRALGGISKVVERQLDERAVEVSMTTLDELVDPERYISLIHLDIEGFEWHAILGARETIARCKPIIILEGGIPEKRQRYIEGFRSEFPDLDYRLVGNMDRNAFFRADCDA
ncbi:FkbM family methyltransferase [Tateyamaria omphalii]|uniref:Methyltransferase FkbM domain-containing protein n=1 Tax=Tateyamaria omphalii TaxID=299262 RepID=A0A1P8MZR9_9RHOB|nr:FkbM family methyltransferase [Tateyamaria omphalii]APX13585.1 hypothetical protein BWR18_19260 [Tateyamaria omphalii]